MAELDNTADILDIRDLIEEIERLESEISERESEIEALPVDEDDSPEQEQVQELRDELGPIAAFVEQFKSYGGDHEWRGAWYPVTMIRDSYFTDYAQELAEDIGAINPDERWPNNCIDWDRAARELQMDYTSGAYGDVTYWAR